MGSHEFSPDNFNAPLPASTPPVSTDQVRRVYDALGIDAGYLSPEAAALFRMARSLPINFHVVGQAPVTQRVQVNGQSVGLVFFPAIPLGADNKPEPDAFRAALAAVLEAGRALRDTRLLVGISPWGATTEETAMPHLTQLYHVLLGGGPGQPVTGVALPQAPGTLWVRPEGKGTGVHVIDIHTLPAKNDPNHHWVEGVSVTPRVQRLDQPAQEDPDVAALLRF